MHESKVISKGQTTLPRDVRAALKINAGDKLWYVVSGERSSNPDGVVCSRAIGNVGKAKSSARICRRDG